MIVDIFFIQFHTVRCTYQRRNLQKSAEIHTTKWQQEKETRRQWVGYFTFFVWTSIYKMGLLAYRLLESNIVN